MILKITDKVPQPVNPKEAYIIEVDLMHGDGDHYDKLVVCQYSAKREKAIELLFETINLLEKMKKVYSDEYSGIENFDELVGDEWPSDITTDYQFKATLTGYKVYYYDANGEKYNVQVLESSDQED